MSIVSALCDRSAKARLLFLSFWRWANYTHANPRIYGLGFIVVGFGMVAVAIPEWKKIPSFSVGQR